MSVGTWQFTVPGSPVPEARARHGRGGVVFKTEKSRRFAARVIFAAKAAPLLRAFPTPADGLLEVWLTFFTEDRRAMDLENLSKGVCDAVTDSGVGWSNDHRIWELHLRRYVSGDRPRTEVLWRVLEVADETPPRKRELKTGSGRLAPNRKLATQRWTRLA